MAHQQMPSTHLEAPPPRPGASNLVDRDSAVIVEDALTERALEYARRGDPDGLHFLYVRHADDLFAYVEAIVQRRDTAEHIVDEVFANLPTTLATTKAKRFSFPATVVRTATNMAVEALRRRKVVPLRKPGTRGAPPGRHSLGHALAHLPSEERDVLVLRHAAGLSPAQSAKLLETDERSLARLYDRASSSLRAALREPGADSVAAAEA
jgi:DNA-directed RNA polymerase specialized sigma24 family protein